LYQGLKKLRKELVELGVLEREAVT
jgi:hypothetical protein